MFTLPGALRGTLHRSWRAPIEQMHRLRNNVPVPRLALYRAYAAKAELYFERALAVAREQQAKSWELRASMSLARLWRDQGKRDDARELLLRSTAGLPKASTRSI